jgi:regulator of protease activity HflC (stomatin/prohibitin superfamily)
LSVRYALDAAKLRATSKTLPDNISGEIVEPAVQGVIYKVFARYTVREIFSTKRVEIQQAIEKELTDKLAADGLVLRAVQMGKVDLPADYRRGMNGLLAEELATEKMRYTLELKDKRVKRLPSTAKPRKCGARKQPRPPRASRSSLPRARRKR